MKRFPNNSINHNTGTESVLHLAIKTFVDKIIKERETPHMTWPGQKVVITECELRNGIVDVLDIKRKMAYEIQTSEDEKIEDDKVKRYEQNEEVDHVKILRTEELLPPGYEAVLKAIYEIIKKEVDKLP